MPVGSETSFADEPHLLMNRGCYAQIDRSTVSFNCIHSVCNKRLNKGRKKKSHDARYIHISHQKYNAFFFSNNCTLLLKNCTCNLFCQQQGNKEIMCMYLYLFENGCICVCMYIYMFTYYIYFEILKSLVILANWLALIGAIFSLIAPFFALNRIFFALRTCLILKLRMCLRPNCTPLSSITIL